VVGRIGPLFFFSLPVRVFWYFSTPFSPPLTLFCSGRPSFKGFSGGIRPHFSKLISLLDGWTARVSPRRRFSPPLFFSFPFFFFMMSTVGLGPVFFFPFRAFFSLGSRTSPCEEVLSPPSPLFLVSELRRSLDPGILPSLLFPHFFPLRKPPPI